MSEKKILFFQSGTFIGLFVVKLFLAVLLTSCGAKDKMGNLKDNQDNNPKTESKEVTENKNPDTLRYYYPVTISGKDNNATSVDTARLSTYSGSLLKAKEPVIYTYNGHDVFRLLYFSGNDRCKVISINKKDDKAWVTVKVLSRAAFLKPQPNGRFVPALNTDGSTDTAKEISFSEYEYMANIPVKSELLQDMNESTSIENWNTFANEFKELNFFEMPSYLNEKPDRSNPVFWILEARTGGKYWIVERNKPDGNFLKFCNNLLKLEH